MSSTPSDLEFTPHPAGRLTVCNYELQARTRSHLYGDPPNATPSRKGCRVLPAPGKGVATMSMTERDFEVVADTIREMRDSVQNDLDSFYSVSGWIVLDQLTERLADAFAAHYRRFKRDAFLRATYAPWCSRGLKDTPSVRSRIVYTVGSEVRGDMPEIDTPTFCTFAEAKCAMSTELERRAGRYAQLDNKTGVRIIEAIQSHLRNANGPEWQHSDGSCEFQITRRER